MKSSTGIAALVLLSAAAVYLIVRPGPHDLAETPAAPLSSNDESPQRDEAREAPPRNVPGSPEAPAGLAAILQRHGCLAIGATTVDSSAYQLVAYADVEGYGASVIGPDGVIETFALDFAPNRVGLAMNEQGVPVVGLGDLRLNSKISRDYDTPEPVRIYRGSNLEYSSEKALDFSIARDGKFFWVVEPTSDISSRLLVRNFSSGATFQYDLGHAVAGSSIEGTHSVVTAIDGQSVMLLPDPESFDERVFFSTHEDRTFRLIPPQRMPLIGAIFASANEAYFALGAGHRKSEIVKVAITYEGDDAGVRQVWRVPAGDIVLAGQLRLSADSRWLVNSGGVGVELIDTQAGKVVFRWNSQQEDPKRLLSVDPDAGNPGHDNGRVFGGGIIGDQFLLDRRFGSEAIAACKPGPDQVDCYHRATAKVQHFVDVFDLSDISVDAMPKYRVQVFDSSSDQCVPPFAFHTLDLSDGRVRTVPRAPEAFP